jgi:hypothetical protein
VLPKKGFPDYKMTTPILSLILFCAGAVAYCVSQLILHDKLRWSDGDVSFWGKESWILKYAYTENAYQVRTLIKAPTTYYYKLFNLKYKERFPGSATVFVALTDGYHLCQLLFLLLISGAIAVHTENVILWLLIYRAAFGIVFTVCYKLFAR